MYINNYYYIHSYSVCMYSLFVYSLHSLLLLLYYLDLENIYFTKHVSLIKTYTLIFVTYDLQGKYQSYDINIIKIL